jgi:predicted nucleic acid-binding protein
MVLRRDRVDEEHAHVRLFRSCIEAGHRLFLLGPVLQELLDGIRSAQQFSRLLSALAPMPLAPLRRDTYVLAAKMRNDCRTIGIQASPTDFLIAAACIDSGYPLLTTDKDFERIATYSGLVLIQL